MNKGRGEGSGRDSVAGGAKFVAMRPKKTAKKRAPKKIGDEEGGMASEIVDTMPPIAKKSSTKGVSKDTLKVPTNPPSAKVHSFVNSRMKFVTFLIQQMMLMVLNMF